MKTTAPILAVLCVLGSVMLMAQGQTRPQFSDKKGRFALWFSEFSIEYPDNETTVFDVSGKPAHGYSKDQNLEFSASNIKDQIVFFKIIKVPCNNTIMCCFMNSI